MTDRIPTAAGQYKAVLSEAELQKMQSGQEFIIKITRDDNPVNPGTPYNKASVLPDDVAELICPHIEDPTPADAFRALKTTSVVDSWDDAVYSGPYACAGNPTTNYGPGYSCGYVTRYDTEYGPVIVQNVYYSTCNKVSDPVFHIRRAYIRSGWGEWEHETPDTGTPAQYRTTKFWKGKPVYCKTLHFGEMGTTADAVRKEIEPSGTISEIVSLQVVARGEGGNAMMGAYGGIWNCFVEGISTVAVCNTTGLEGYSVTATVEYTLQ